MSAEARNRKRVPVIGAILAGGASSRMGESKQNLILEDGTPMIAHAHDALSAVCDRVVLLGDSKHLPELERISDLRPGCGPLGGIEALLASSHDADYLVVPCDLPLVTAEVLNALLIATDKLVTIFDGHPLPARISIDALPTVKRLLDRGERAVWRLMDEVDAERIVVPEAWAVLLENVNTPGDVGRIAHRSTRSPGASC